MILRTGLERAGGRGAASTPHELRYEQSYQSPSLATFYTVGHWKARYAERAAVTIQDVIKDFPEREQTESA
jgi:hypothetical protein